MWGITKTDYDQYRSDYGWPAAKSGTDLKTLVTKDRARQIYQDKYWIGAGLDKISTRLPLTAQALMDVAVNAGKGWVGDMLKRGQSKAGIGASDADIAHGVNAALQEFREKLVSANPGKYGPYAKGWRNRRKALDKFIDSQGLQSSNPFMDIVTGHVGEGS